MADFQIINGLESRLSVNNVGDEYFTTWDTDVTIKHIGGGGNNYPDVIEREWKLEVVNGDVLLELTVDINPNEQDNNAENWTFDLSQFAAGYTDGDVLMSISCHSTWIGRRDNGGTSENEYSSEPFLFYVIEDGLVVSAEEEYQGIPQYENFYANIVSVSNNNLEIANTWQEGLNGIIATGEYPKTGINPASTINNWTITYKSNDKRDLNTYLHFGDDNLLLTTNVISDNETFPNSPNSVIYKLYEPLPDDVNEKSMGYIVDEILPEIEDTVELFAYDQEDEEFQVLIPRESLPEDSPITERPTNLQSYTDLVTNNSKLKVEIEDKFLIKKPAELSVDYSNYENFVNFSSAEKRLKNFKYKLQQIEKNTALSASFVGVTNGNFDLEKHVTEIRNIKNNFDGYEKYLYNIKSTYASSSIGVFQDASWPKVGSGTYADPYKPVSSSNADFISWYGSVSSKTGQIYSASFYDQQNGNRLVNLLPEHISSDLDNTQFLDFMDMAGQQFDELWSYIKSMSDITDRRLDLNEGFSKDLVFSLAKSLGWDTQDGKDLLDLSRYGFGQKLSGDSYSLYTSGSLSSPVEADVSKEITKRLIASMPFILKSKGTEASIKAILNCYGIPSTILKVREFGGLDTSTQRAPFETKRRFTKALGFRSAQFVSSSWTDDIVTSRKPETVEMRFRSVSGSDQVLLQKDNDWAIKLKDNGSIDNYGTVAFALSGSDGYHEVSSSLLTVFDGEYHSLMLTKEKTNQQLFPNPDFETSALFSPPFETDTNNVNNGTIKIVSSSASAFSLYGTRSLEHINTSNITSPKVSSTPFTQSLANVSLGEQYTFSAYARVSGSTVDSVGRLRIYELDSNGDVVNWNEDSNWTYPSITDNGGVKSSDTIGLAETEWKKIKVNKTIRFLNTSKLGVSFENLKAQSTIFWDAVDLRKLSPNNDSIHDSYDYTLYVKKYEAGLDRIIQSSVASLTISGSNTATSSYNAAWTGSGELFIGGKASSVFGNQLTGSLMEFRLWNEPLKEQLFDVHVSDPKSYVGNTPSSSYESLVVRYSFDDNTNLSDGTDIRDVSSNQTITVEGYPIGFGGLNTFESVVDETKTIVPNYGPNRRTSDKIRIENNFLSGSGASLNTTQRFDFSSNDFSPVDSPKVGIYFSPTDTINDDILASFANIDFNQLLGDPRDNFKTEYPELKESANKYFQKYTGKNDFWDYMRLIKYYDQSIFKQFKKVLPMRAKPQLGTVIEPNIFERSKNPIQRNNPSFTQIDYDSKINVSNFNYNVDNDGVNQEASQSLLKISTEYPVYEGELDKQVFRFDLPSLYKFAANDNFDDRNLYISGSAKYGTPDYVYQEPTGAMVINQRLSEHNQEYKFFYNSAEDWAKSSLYSIDPHVNFYNSKSLYTSDKDTSYQHTLAFRRLFYEGVKNTSDTTIDGDLPFIVTSTAPTVAVPTNSGISKLSIDQSGNKRIIARPVNNTESSNNNNSE